MNFAVHPRNRPLNGATPPEDDDAESDHDSADSVSSMSSEEIESHFIERHGRWFHSHGNGGTGPYPFPVDDIEAERLNNAHELVKAVLQGQNYRGPVQQVLEAPSGRRRLRVLDLCTGTGRWVEEMAYEFNYAKVYGLDIVPMATRYPADNVQFEIHDINERTRWADGRFDLVHMRNVYLAVTNYPMIVREIARLLCPQGLFLSGEWYHTICSADGSEAPELAPGVSQLIQRVVTLAAQRGPPAVPHTLPMQIRGILQASGYFEQIVRERHVVALDDSERGQRAKLMLLDFGDSARGFLLNSGLPAEQVEGLLGALRDDLDNIAGINLLYLSVHARRNAVHWQ